MTESPDRLSEPELQRRYRETTGERTPAELDRAVLAAARAAVAESRRPWMPSWTRPLALAATVVLGFVLVQDIRRELDEPPLVGSPANSTAPADNLLRDDLPRDAAPQTPATSEPSAGIADETAPALTVTPAAPDARRAAPAAREAAPEADRPASRLQPAETGVTATALEEQKREQRARSGATTESAGLSSANFATKTGERQRLDLQQGAAPAAGASSMTGCDEQARATAESWWQCIVALRAAGLPDIADAESRDLATAFPEFAVPE